MKKIILTAFVFAITLVLGQQLLPASASAATDPNVCQGIMATGATSCTNDGGKITGIVRTVINLLSIIVGVAAVIMIIVGGLKYVTSQGESSATASAKNTILYAIIGLVIAAIAQFLVHYVLSKAGAK
jgi:hypothetical protein